MAILDRVALCSVLVARLVVVYQFGLKYSSLLFHKGHQNGDIWTFLKLWRLNGLLKWVHVIYHYGPIYSLLLVLRVMSISVSGWCPHQLLCLAATQVTLSENISKISLMSLTNLCHEREKSLWVVRLYMWSVCSGLLAVAEYQPNLDLFIMSDVQLAVARYGRYGCFLGSSKQTLGTSWEGSERWAFTWITVHLLYSAPPPVQYTSSWTVHLLL